MAVALAHDYLLVARGAERTFAAIADMWPAAPVYTLLHDPAAMGDRLAGHAVHTSPVQRLGARQRTFRALLPLLPWAAGRLDARGHDLVVSSSSAFAHGVRVGEDAVHLCYCYTPFRYAWHERAAGLAMAPRMVRPVLDRVLDAIREWDLRASRRVTHYVACGEIGRERIADFYGREADVIHPPVEIERFAPGTPEDFFLVVGEVSTHKRVDLALEAAARAGVPLVVVGDGPDLARLRARHGDRATFLGRVADDELARIYARARALVVAKVEEFGITAVEAQAAGRPVLAVDAGGARETVIDGQTGVLATPDDGDALAEAMRHVDWERFVPADAVANARRFSTAAFQRGIRDQVQAARTLPARHDA